MHSFLWLSNIPLCICTTASFREGNGNPLQYSCLENPMDGGAWWSTVHGVAKSQTQLEWLSKHHSFFIHSSVDEHIGCFHVLAIVNYAAMNNGIHVSFSILVSSGYMPRSSIAGSYGGFIPSFLRISITSSIVAVSIYIPTNSARVFPFLHTLSSSYCL